MTTVAATGNQVSLPASGRGWGQATMGGEIYGGNGADTGDSSVTGSGSLIASGNSAQIAKGVTTQIGDANIAQAGNSIGSTAKRVNVWGIMDGPPSTTWTEIKL